MTWESLSANISHGVAETCPLFVCVNGVGSLGLIDRGSSSENGDLCSCGSRLDGEEGRFCFRVGGLLESSTSDLAPARRFFSLLPLGFSSCILVLCDCRGVLLLTGRMHRHGMRILGLWCGYEVVCTLLSDMVDMGVWFVTLGCLTIASGGLLMLVLVVWSWCCVLWPWLVPSILSVLVLLAPSSLSVHSPELVARLCERI